MPPAKRRRFHPSGLSKSDQERFWETLAERNLKHLCTCIIEQGGGERWCPQSALWEVTVGADSENDWQTGRCCASHLHAAALLAEREALTATVTGKRGALWTVRVQPLRRGALPTRRIAFFLTSD